jgi:hypothetical protein
MTGGEITSNAHVASSAADDVHVADTRWWDALLQPDVVVLESLLANDLTFHSPIGTISTKAEFVERVRSGFLKIQLRRGRGAADPVARRPRHRDRPRRHPVSGARTANVEGLYYTAIWMDHAALAHARLAVHGTSRD